MPIKEMTPEEWQQNFDCALKKREHKWAWVPSMDPDVNAQCVHCGLWTYLHNKWNAELNEPPSKT